MRQKAFTLIELLVVISIIALLLSVLVPSLGKAKKAARAVVCRSNLKQWGVVFLLYGSENNESFPQNYPGDGMTAFDSYWCHATMPYYEFKDFRFCPSTKKNPTAMATVASGGTKMEYGGTFMNWGPFAPENSATPSNWWDEFPEGSYGMNEWCSNPPSDTTKIWGAPVELTWRKITNVSRGNATPLFLDCKLVDGYPRDTDSPPSDPEQHDGYLNNSMKMYCMDRHDKGINSVFVDGSVRKILLKELWKQKWNPEFNTSGKWTQAGGARAEDWPEWMTGYKEY